MGKIEAMMIQPSGSLDEDYMLSASIAYVFGSRDSRPAPAPVARPETYSCSTTCQTPGQ